MTKRLINSLAALLERTSAITSSLPIGLRDDIILMEHQDALTRTGEEPQDTRAPLPSAPSVQVNAVPQLVTKVDITTTSTDFRTTFHPASGDAVQVRLSRANLHRLVDMTRKADEAEWAIPINVPWLGTEQPDAAERRVLFVLH